MKFIRRFFEGVWASIVTALFIIIFLWLEFAGIYHAFAHHGVRDGFISVFVPPYSWYRSVDFIFWMVLEGRAERKSEWKNLNRIYNLYLVRDFGEMRSGPCTQIILCDVHAERFKKIVKKDPDTHIYRSRARKKGITPLPCVWCDDPEEFEDMEGKIEVKKTDETEGLERR